MEGAVCVFQLKGHITPVRTVVFSPDGLALVSGGVGGLMNIWSLRDGSVLQTVIAGSGAIQNIVWIPDVGVAVCSNRSKVRWNIFWNQNQFTRRPRMVM
uniref:Uncharacterized protein n=1 Tax=Hucho hucho TaxID=62062 RepID=A0A4W5KTS0_9TELE